jgi:hypothetical protein
MPSLVSYRPHKPQKLEKLSLNIDLTGEWGLAHLDETDRHRCLVLIAWNPGSNLKQHFAL